MSKFEEEKSIIIDKIYKEMHFFIGSSNLDRLTSAMSYSCKNLGKMLRPLFVYYTAKMFGYNEYGVIKAACAIEIVHNYSLIHDDLPCMDDDELRRGVLTCHLKYDEATAILAGDALLTIAFEILSDSSIHSDANIRCKIINILAKSIGNKGMAGGQMLDLLYENKVVTEEEVIKMLEMKTANLFASSMSIGAVLANVENDILSLIDEFAMKFGLAYQIIDDILDIVGDEKLLGKKTAKDIKLGKSSIVNYKGIEYAKNKAEDLMLEAKNILNLFPCDKKDLAFFIDTIDSISSSYMFL